MHVSIGVCRSRRNFSDLSPEVVGVPLRSVVALIFKRNNRGEHFALCAAQRGPAHH